METNIVEIRNLHFKNTINNTSIYSGINVNIKRGKITAIMGPSGIGKTTLLRLIGGQLNPDQGQIKVFNQDISELSRKELYSIRRNIGVLFQSGALLNDLTCFENIAYPIEQNTNLDEQLINRIVLMKLQTVGLRGIADLYPHELSGGMQRRVALARAIALDPELIMYDEPFVGQDPVSMGVILQLIKELNKSMNITSIIVSHDVNEVLSIADYVYLLMEEKIKAEGKPEDIVKNKDPLVQQFINGYSDGPIQFHKPTKKSYFEDLDIRE